LCEHCKEPAEENKNISTALYNAVFSVIPDLAAANLHVKHESGCEHCHGRGEIGRIVCAEVMVPDPIMFEHINKGNDTAAYRHWRSHKSDAQQGRGHTAFDHAILNMSLGIISPQTVEKSFGNIMMPEIIEDGIIEGREVRRLEVPDLHISKHGAS
jgi:type II secretory ATPase GspE/PulE/Tfp pilus assembly ATPase PilB-like protein